MMNQNEKFSDPLVDRYASADMVACFSNQARYQTWRQIWLALAEAEQKLGLPITDKQIAAIKSVVGETVDFETAAKHENELHHDVMAHLYTFAERCPEAKPILHLGATSAFVTDNTDMILMQRGLKLVAKRLQSLCQKLASFAEKYRNLPTVGYTHFQVAMPTTVGRRAAYWLQDLMIDGLELRHRLENLKLRGAKGATGTQASFVKLFAGDVDKVTKLDQAIADAFGFKAAYPLTGQTYPRKADSQVLAALTGIGESLSKMATDLRLLQHMKEVEEPFGKKQIGSSAMPFKRNPILAERICSLARMLSGYYLSSVNTTSTQWLERSLDDSAVRRLSIPRAFLLADALLTIAERMVAGLEVHENVVSRHFNEQAPFLLTEMLMMEAVNEGGDRQDIHEIIRSHSMKAYRRVQDEGKDNNLLKTLAEERIFTNLIKRAKDENWQETVLIGRAPAQVEHFLNSDEYKSFVNWKI